MRKTLLAQAFLVAIIGLMFLAGSAQAVGKVTPPHFTKDLHYGMRNDSDVRLYQQFLKDVNYYDGPVTGNFFGMTLTASKIFQQANEDKILKPAGLTEATGYVGRFTREFFNTVIEVIPKPIEIIPTPGSNLPPVINGVSGPTVLGVNQAGTWTVQAYDPENGTLSYSVDWGDYGPSVITPSPAALSGVTQSTTFTHSYAVAGTYNASFKVQDSAGLVNKTSISVKVGDVSTKTFYIADVSGITKPIQAGDRLALTIKAVELYDGGPATYDEGFNVQLQLTNTLTSQTVIQNNGTNGGNATYNSDTGYWYFKANETLNVAKYSLKVFLYCSRDEAVCASRYGRAAQVEQIINFEVQGTSPVSITVLSPNGGETWTKGTTQIIKWQDNTPITCPTSDPYCMRSLPAPRYYDIKLTSINSSCIGQEICPALYMPSYTIAQGVSGSSYSWYYAGKIVNYDGTGGTAPDGAYTIQICQSGTSTCDSSDSYFKIVSSGNPAVTSFTYTATDAYGGSIMFSWKTQNANKVTMWFKCQTGITITDAVTGKPSFCSENDYALAANGSAYIKAVNNTADKIQITVGVRAFTGPDWTNGGDASYLSFWPSLAPVTTSSVMVISPNGGETWMKGATQTIKWFDAIPIAVCGQTNCSPIMYYDIKLATYYPPCTSNICPLYAYRAPYIIGNSVGGSSYQWPVGKAVDLNGGLVPDGSYTIQVCQSGTTTCDSSDSYFKIVSPVAIP